VILSWDNPGNSNITKYQYRQGVNVTNYEFGNWTDIGGSNASTTNHTVTGLTNGNIYSFQVRAMAGPLHGPGSDTELVQPLDGAVAIAAPTGFRATAGNRRVTLSWNNPGANSNFTRAREYQYRQRSAATSSWGNWTDISGSHRETTSHTVTGLTNGTEYSFQVRGVGFIWNARGTIAFREGKESHAVSATPFAPTGPAAPTGLKATAGNRRATLSWDNPSNSDITKYQYRQGSGSWTDIANSDADTTSHVVTGLTNDVTYSFQVRAVAGNLNGTPSATVTATPTLVVLTPLALVNRTRLVFSPTSLTVGEGGSGSYTVKLATRPTGTVTVTVGGASGEVTVDTNSGSEGNQTTLTFTTGNWNTAQPVTVSAGEDDDAVNDAATLSHTATGGGYNSVSGNLEVTVTDDDTAALVFSPTSVTVGEGGSGSYTVKLATQPSATVTVAITGQAGTDLTLDKTTLTFTTGNWNDAQPVAVAAGEDDDAVNDAATLSHTATGGGYNSISGDLEVTVTDDDDPNNAPTVANAIADQSATAGTAFSYQFPANTFHDADGDPLGYSASKADDSALPTWLSFTEGSRTFSGTPTAADVGVLAVKVTADDSNGDSVSDTFNIEVKVQMAGLQTLPTVSFAAAGSTVAESGGTQNVAVSISPAPTTAITVNYEVSGTATEDTDFSISGSGTVTVPANSSSVNIPVVITDDDVDEDGETVILTLVSGIAGYTVGSAKEHTLTITDDDTAALVFSIRGNNMVMEGTAASFIVTASPAPTSTMTILRTVEDVPGSNFLSPEDEDDVNNNPLIFSAGQSAITFAIRTTDDDIPEQSGNIQVALYPSQGKISAEVMVMDDDQPPLSSERKATWAWQTRLGRTIAQQVVDAVQGRFTAPPPLPGLRLTVAGEDLTATPLEENQQALVKLLGFETVSVSQLVTGSAFSFSPQPPPLAAGEGEDAAPRLSFWGQGALSSFHGQEDTLSLDGSVTTALAGVDWRTQRWHAGAAFSRSWGNGSYGGDNDGDGDLGGTLTGLFPYGRYALTPRLGVWAVAGYGWGTLSVKPDKIDRQYQPTATMAMGAVGLDGLLIDGGADGFSLSATTDLLTVKTTTEETDGLAAAEGSVSRLRLGLEATRPFPLANGASLLPSVEMGIRHDGGDAETGFGMELGAGILWNDPQRGISAEVKGRSLLTHMDEQFQEQGLALSFAWKPSPTNRGPSLSLSHAMGDAASGIHALLDPIVLEGLDSSSSTASSSQFNAELAYGFPAANNRLTLTPALALALSPTTRTYSLLWSLAPYSEQMKVEPWQLSLEGQREETTAASVDHSLKLSFSLLF